MSHIACLFPNGDCIRCTSLPDKRKTSRTEAPSSLGNFVFSDCGSRNRVSSIQSFISRRELFQTGLCCTLVFPQGNKVDAAQSSRITLENETKNFESDFVEPIDPAEFVPGPVEVGWQIWVGAIAGAFPFMIGLSEFTKRIMIQRRCETCSGTGLVTMRERGVQVKCPQCGGFFPWRSWGEFLSANARPGNGGVLRFPRGQTSVLYEVPEAQRREPQEPGAGDQAPDQGNSAPAAGEEQGPMSGP